MSCLIVYEDRLAKPNSYNGIRSTKAKFTFDVNLAIVVFPAGTFCMPPAQVLTTPPPGDVEITFALPWMNSSQSDTYESRNHPSGIFVIETYYKTCPHCNDNAPNVNSLTEKYKNHSRVQVLDVGVDQEKSKYHAWIQQHSPNHPVLMDVSRKLTRELGTQGYPSTYVLDCNGQVKAETVGSWGTQERRKIENAIDALLQEQCMPMPPLPESD